MTNAPPNGPSRGQLAMAIGACAVAIAVVAGSSWLTPEGVLRARLARWQFWTLELQFLVLVGASLHQVRRVVSELRAPRRVWAAVGACSVLCFVLSAFVAPRTSRIYFDEQIYQGVGQSLADTRVAQMCNEGTVEYGRLQCWNGEYNKQPYGYPYVLSVAYRVSGVGPQAAHIVNNVAASLIVVVVFLVVALAFRDLYAAVGGALVMAVIPMQLTWSNTAASEPTAALACAIAALAAFQFVRTRSTAALVWTVSAGVFGASFRPESLLVVLLVAGILALLAHEEMVRPRVWWAIAAAALGGWNITAHLVAVRHDSWGASGQRMALEFLERNLSTNGWFYLWDERFPFAFTLLALIGIVAGRRHRAVWALLCYFLLFWGIFLVFYAGSYDYGADVRYSLMTYPPLAMLAGLGGAWVVRRLATRVGDTVAVSTATALLLFHLLLFLPLVRAVGEEAWGAREDVEFITRTVQVLPDNAMVLTHTPSVFHLLGINAAQTSLAMTNQSRVSNEFFERYAGGVYLHWNFWCNVADPAQRAYCTAVLERFDSEVVAESRVRNYRFALYRLRVRPSTASER